MPLPSAMFFPVTSCITCVSSKNAIFEGHELFPFPATPKVATHRRGRLLLSGRSLLLLLGIAHPYYSAAAASRQCFARRSTVGTAHRAADFPTPRRLARRPVRKP